VASRLSEIPHWRVLLIEAGGPEPTGTQVPSMFLNFLGSDIDWAYRTEPEENACLNEVDRRCYWPRGKVPVQLISLVTANSAGHNHSFRIHHSSFSCCNFFSLSIVYIHLLAASSLSLSG
jgi:hypothetical protein